MLNMPGLNGQPNFKAVNQIKADKDKANNIMNSANAVISKSPQKREVLSPNKKYRQPSNELNNKQFDIQKH